MRKQNRMTSYVFMWEGQDGKRRWEAIESGQTEGFLKKLMDEGVHPATVMVAYAPILFHFVWPEFHQGLSDVNFHKIDEEIYGTAPIEKKHEPVDVPVEKPKPKYGWIAPDGRFFACDYGGHSHLANKIVGEVEYVPDPQKRLEELGWVRIFSGSFSGRRYAVGMGPGKKLTDAQIKALQRMQLDRAYGVSDFL